MSNIDSKITHFQEALKTDLNYSSLETLEKEVDSYLENPALNLTEQQLKILNSIKSEINKRKKALQNTPTPAQGGNPAPAQSSSQPLESELDNLITNSMQKSKNKKNNTP